MIDKPVSAFPLGLDFADSVYSEVSRRLGFLRFCDLDHSRAFLEPNFPSIYFIGPNHNGDDRGTRVRIAYSREREDRARARAEGDWTCRMVGQDWLQGRIKKLTRVSAPLSIIPPGKNVSAVKHLGLVSCIVFHLKLVTDNEKKLARPVHPV